MLLSIVYSKFTESNIGYTLLVVLISLSFNYILFFITIVITYIINKINVIENDFINMIFMMIIQIVLLYEILRVKKLKIILI